MSRSTGVSSAVLLAAVALAGCGGGEKKSGSSSGESAAAGGGAYATTTSASKTTAAGSGEKATVMSKSNPTLGTILAAGPKRLTVYMFASDHGASSTCYGACASAWPPVTTTGGAAKAAGGASAAKLGTITRKEGVKQVTYGGHPLYYYAADRSEGDILGQGITAFGAAWYVLSPSGKTITRP